MLQKVSLALLLLCSFAWGAPSKAQMEKLIGNMFMVGFHGSKIDTNAQIIKDIQKYNLAGVILFAKNISSPSQLKELTRRLRNSSNDLLIAVDQEGGKVQRLSPKNGFSTYYPNAVTVAATGNVAPYTSMAQELSGAGVNFNLAPVVDLALNPKNSVIVGLKRSYGSDPKVVANYAASFIQVMSDKNVLTSIKHFPGHGSSVGDTHKGFVDVSNDWQSKELLPYKYLIDSGMVDTVMVAHVFNAKIDAKLPASLSHKTITGVLRGELGYEGVVISDDLQMQAISKHYSLQDTIALAINAGVDILLFCNQLDPKLSVSTQKLIDTTYALYQSGRVSLAQIMQANERINQLKTKL